MKSKLTGEWLYDAHHRAKGDQRLHPELEPTWADQNQMQREYWNKLAAMVRAKVRSK